MQKISSYLLHNRIELVADLAGFITEYKPVYKRHIRVYRGIDNLLEFDVKNADQKRIDLGEFDTLEMHVMDNTGQALPSSPYTVEPLDQETSKGLATVTIPAIDLDGLIAQGLTYSVVANGNTILYADSRFGASGNIDLITTAIPVAKPVQKYDHFLGLGDFNNTTITYTSDAVSLRTRDAVPPNHIHVEISVTNLKGTIWVEATKQEVIGHESFTHSNGTRVYEQVLNPATTDTITVPLIDLLETGYTYIRVNWTTDPTITTGKIDFFTVEFHAHPPEVPC
jgi:hypothetical protein